MPENNEENQELERTLGSNPIGEAFGKTFGFGGGNPQTTQSPVNVGDYDISDFVTSPSGELQPPPTASDSSSVDSASTSTDLVDSDDAADSN